MERVEGVGGGCDEEKLSHLWLKRLEWLPGP
jgi:hypothetical protein